MKSFMQFMCGVLLGAFLVMLYLHKEMICKAIKGEEIPKAPESCPFSKCESAEEAPAAEE